MPFFSYINNLPPTSTGGKLDYRTKQTTINATWLHLQHLIISSRPPKYTHTNMPSIDIVDSSSIGLSAKQDSAKYHYISLRSFSHSQHHRLMSMRYRNLLALMSDLSLNASNQHCRRVAYASSSRWSETVLGGGSIYIISRTYKTYHRHNHPCMHRQLNSSG